MSKTICGMTLDEYIKFHCEFVDLTRQISDGDATDDDIIPFLKKHGQEPVIMEGADILDPIYYMGAGLKPWEDEIIKDPQMQSQKAMALLNFQNQQIHGDSADSADIEIEGLSLEGYAHICAVSHGGGDVAPLYKKYGVRDQEHFNEINNAYWAAMNTDATGMLATHYSDFFMKYSPQHAATVNQMMADAMEAGTKQLEDTEKRTQEVYKTVKKMAKSGAKPVDIAAYVRETITDAEDEDELDYYLENSMDELVDNEKWDAVKILLQARFEILQPGGDMEEWVEEEMESLK
ncbi:MAG: hypothetical protein JXB49_10370 [Bacteroidales bacterium]|nr:hypothetical protein [Bacteroidales bacterium]